jgi:hypothetical protein
LMLNKAVERRDEILRSHVPMHISDETDDLIRSQFPIHLSKEQLGR